MWLPTTGVPRWSRLPGSRLACCRGSGPRPPLSGRWHLPRHGRGGLPVGIPVSVGCGDAAATLVAVDPGPDQLIVTVGTGIQVISPGTEPRADAIPRHHTFASATGDYYAMVAPMNGGLALARVCEVVGAGWAELYGSLDSGPLAVGSAVFLPYFAAERLPRPISAGSAGWHGLGLDSGRNTLLRSALESVAFLTRRAVATLPGSGMAELRLVGGGTRDRRFQPAAGRCAGTSGTTMPHRERHRARRGPAGLGGPWPRGHRSGDGAGGRARSERDLRLRPAF